MKSLALAVFALTLIATGGEAPQVKMPPNAPTQIIVERDSSVAEWAALVGGVGTLLAGLEVFRRRRRRE